MINSRRGNGLIVSKQAQSIDISVTATSSDSYSRNWALYIDRPVGAYPFTDADYYQAEAPGATMKYSKSFEPGQHYINFIVSSGDDYQGTLGLSGFSSSQFTGVNLNSAFQVKFTISGGGTGTTSANPNITAVSQTAAVSQGSVFSYKGTGFTPNGNISRERINFDGSIAHTDSIVADGSGNVNDSFTLDSYDYIGSQTLQLTDVTSGLTTSLIYNVVAKGEGGTTGTVPENPKAVAVTNTSSVPQGSVFSYTGTGFAMGGTVTRERINFDGSIAHTDTIKADSNGNISDSFTLDSYDYIGQETLQLTDNTSGMQTSLVYQVVAATKTPTPPVGVGGGNPPTQTLYFGLTLLQLEIAALGVAAIGILIIVVIATSGRKSIK